MARRCEWCGDALDGMRGDARFCTGSHRTLAYRRRLQERAIAAAVAAAERRLLDSLGGLQDDDRRSTRHAGADIGA